MYSMDTADRLVESTRELSWEPELRKPVDETFDDAIRGVLRLLETARS